jgi:hypothetical protein
MFCNLHCSPILITVYPFPLPLARVPYLFTFLFHVYFSQETLRQEFVALIKDVERDRLKPSNFVSLSENEIDGEEDEVDPDISTLS